MAQSTTEQILRDVTGFIEDLLVDLEDDVKHCLQNGGVDPDQIPGLADLFNSESAYAKSFAGLETQYSQLTFYKRAFNFVVSYQYLCYYRKLQVHVYVMMCV